MCEIIENIELSAVLPIFISVILGFIAYQQMRINRNKLKLDLYNKRFEVYLSALSFYQEVTSDGPSKECHRDFINKKESAYFLFSKNKIIYDLLNKMHNESFKISAFRTGADELRDSPDVLRKAREDSQNALSWFHGVVDLLREEMKSYLSFS